MPQALVQSKPLNPKPYKPINPSSTRRAKSRSECSLFEITQRYSAILGTLDFFHRQTYIEHMYVTYSCTNTYAEPIMASAAVLNSSPAQTRIASSYVILKVRFVNPTLLRGHNKKYSTWPANDYFCSLTSSGVRKSTKKLDRQWCDINKTLRLRTSR